MQGPSSRANSSPSELGKIIDSVTLRSAIPMLPDIQRAVGLQHTDDRIAALAKEIAALPRHVAEIEKKLEGSRRKLDHDRAALAANQRERKGLETEIQTQNGKTSKLKT